MYSDAILQYAREKGISAQDAAQTFLQVLVLRNLSLPEVRFIGGTALVLGFGNPRFSEDVDLTQVSDPSLLRPSLSKAVGEIERWLSCPVILTSPKSGSRTWRIVCRLGRAESLTLHVDSQPYRSYTTHPLVLQFPSIPAFVVEAMTVTEIMSEKVIALAYRKYLGGRDLFDLWFHWLRLDGKKSQNDSIRTLIEKKMKERKLPLRELKTLLESRLVANPALSRAREEWKRYLPGDFQKETVFKSIVDACRTIPAEIFP